MRMESSNPLHHYTTIEAEDEWSSAMEADAQSQCFLSDAQKRMWILQQIEGRSPQYCIPLTLRVEGDIRFDRLVRSCHALLDKHAILRSSVFKAIGRPMLKVTGKKEIRLYDLAADEEEADEEAVKRILLAELNEGFNFESGPLARFVLVRSKEETYTVMLLMHHIVTDGWSNQLLIRDLMAFYNVDEALRAYPVIGLDRYASFVEREAGFLRSDEYTHELRFWQEQLAGYKGPFPIPQGSVRPRQITMEGAEVAFSLPQSTSAKLRKLCKATGATPFMITLSAFMLLLHRYSGESDIAVGTPIANRLDEQDERTVGLFANTVVIRSIIDGQGAYTDFLEQVRDTAFEVYGYQSVPLGKVMEGLQLQRDLSRNPFVQHLFVWGMSDRHLDMNGCSAQPYRFDTGTSKFDITLSIEERNGAFCGAVEYNTKIYQRNFLDQFIDHYKNILKGVLENPRQSVNDIGMLSSAELRKYLKPNKKTIPDEQNAYRLFERQALRYADSTAIIDGNDHITYGQLLHRAERLASFLREKGVTRNEWIGIYIPKSISYVIAVLAIMKAGGAFVPLDPDYPAERLRLMVSDSRMKRIVTDQSQADIVDASVELLHVSEQSEPMDNYTINGDDLAYMIYTSGSTGRPKGVMVKHSSLANVVASAKKSFEFKPSMRVSQFVSINFDVSVMEIFSTLASGATLYMIDRQNGIQVERVYEFLRIHQIEATNLPVSLLNHLIGRELPHLQTVFTGGERCLPEVAEYWSRDKVFFNIYGPTETTIAATWFKGTNLKEFPEVSIGKPIDNVCVYILDEHMRICPPGIVGEIYIGGAGVALGYMNLSNERFIDNPLSDQDEYKRLYRTGDFGTFTADGDILFRGRKDEQVKLNGYRVELSEVEQLLKDYTGVKDAAVTIRTVSNANGSAQQFIAHIVPNLDEDHAALQSSLRSYLMSLLPSYMLPAYYDCLKELPLTSNDKVDRAALRDRPLAAAGSAKSPLTSEIERELAEIWVSILECEAQKIGRESDYFELGGHSLLAPLLIEEIFNKFNISIPLKVIFEHSTLQRLAEYIAGNGDESLLDSVEVKA